MALKKGHTGEHTAGTQGCEARLGTAPTGRTEWPGEQRVKEKRRERHPLFMHRHEDAHELWGEEQHGSSLSYQGITVSRQKSGGGPEGEQPNTGTSGEAPGSRH